MGESPPVKSEVLGESIKQILVLGLDAWEQGVSWGLITLLRMPSLLPHDLCHGRSSSPWLPAMFQMKEQDKTSEEELSEDRQSVWVEFRVVIMKMVKRTCERMDAQSRKLVVYNKELGTIKNNQIRIQLMKWKIYKMVSTVEYKSL